MTPTIKKRKYSRAGCEECKRRKMKCDEAKPFCFNCTRLRKSCVYRSRASSTPNSGGNATPLAMDSAGPQFKHYLPKVIKIGQNGKDEYDTSSANGLFEDVEKAEKTGEAAEIPLTQGDLQSIFNDAWLLVNDIIDLPLDLDTKEVEVGPIDVMGHLVGENGNDKQQQQQDPETAAANNAANNNTANGASVEDNNNGKLKQMEFSNSENSGGILSSTDATTPTISPNTLFDSFTSFPNVTFSPVQSTTIQDLIEHIIAHHNLATPHSSYLQALNDPVVSRSFFPFALSSSDNVVINLLLQYANQCPYLLSALLAMIATVQFNVSGEVYHELCGQKYVLVCLKSLSRAFATTDATSRTSHIERLLLTVMLLTSIFSSKTYENVVSSWKTHLRGAKDLLMRYSGSSTKITAGLALAKTWFFAIDSLAVITTRLGGTVKESAVFEETGYFDRGAYHDALKELGLVIDLPSGCRFNLFLGFSMEFVLFLQHFSKCLDTLRAGSEIDYRQVTQMMSLVNQVQFTEIVPRVDYQTYTVLDSSPAHPRHELMGLPASAFGIVTSTSPIASNGASPSSIQGSVTSHHTLSPSISPSASSTTPNNVSNGNNHNSTTTTTIYSWYDISQQCRCNAIYLRFLLLDGLLPTTNHSLIQQLINNIMNCLFFVLPRTPSYYDSRRDIILAQTEHYFISSDLFDTRCYMIQSAFRVVTGLVVEEESFEKLELFFTGLIKLGNGLAMEALQRVADRRQMVREGHSQMEVNWAEVVPFN